MAEGEKLGDRGRRIRRELAALGFGSEDGEAEDGEGTFEIVCK